MLGFKLGRNKLGSEIKRFVTITFLRNSKINFCNVIKVIITIIIIIIIITTTTTTITITIIIMIKIIIS